MNKHRPTAPDRFSVDGVSDVTRETVKLPEQKLGINESQEVHRALREMPAKLALRYGADDGALSSAQMQEIAKRVPQGVKKSVRSCLLTASSS